ncbi:MAG TPA: SDR family NAD(P)-dependent oxidoreductase, partial [Solirubrobacterales bacterium]|nr:SDR family NAD(P)-dependent oxidoreductase [Solirubrobacterales bacterium]
MRGGARLLDYAMDRLVVPGYSRFGYGVRERLMGWTPVEAPGRAVMVTGASSGIGEAACATLIAGGAEVHMVVRDLERGESARARALAAAEAMPAAAPTSDAAAAPTCDTAAAPMPGT